MDESRRHFFFRAMGISCAPGFAYLTPNHLIEPNILPVNLNDPFHRSCIRRSLIHALQIACQARIVILADHGFGQHEFEGETHHHVCGCEMLAAKMGRVANLRLEEVEMEGQLRPEDFGVDVGTNDVCIDICGDVGRAFEH